MSYVRYGNTVTSRITLPDECPTCGRLVVFPNNMAVLAPFSHQLQTVHHCPNKDCGSVMVCYHTSDNANNWQLKSTEPPNLGRIDLPDFVAEISPDFVSIFREAVEAKERGLKQIAGPGYRKAFEFLIKDYAKTKAPAEQVATIENLTASAVVTKYITDVRVQAVAKRALWIGNDETHYLRKWDNKDINDLGTLIKLTIEWIDIERLSAAYIEEMPEGQKQG